MLSPEMTLLNYFRRLTLNELTCQAGVLDALYQKSDEELRAYVHAHLVAANRACEERCGVYELPF